jgi:hypothetical protein
MHAHTWNSCDAGRSETTDLVLVSNLRGAEFLCKGIESSEKTILWPSSYFILDTLFAQRCNFPHKSLDVCLAFEPGRRHVANLSEDLAAHSRHDHAARRCQRRSYSHWDRVHRESMCSSKSVSVRTPVGASAPFQDLFGPIHAHVIVHVPRVHYFPLGGVPMLVVGLGGLQLSFGVGVPTPIMPVRGKCPLRPCRHASVGVVIGREIHKIHGQLTPDDQLFEERFLIFKRHRCLHDLSCHVQRRNVAEVKIHAQVRRVVGLRLVAASDVMGHSSEDKRPKACFGF